MIYYGHSNPHESFIVYRVYDAKPSQDVL